MSQTQTEVLSEHGAKLGFTDAPVAIVPVPGPGGHQDLFTRRVPTLGTGPLRLTLIPSVKHLEAFAADVEIPEDGNWHRVDGFGRCWLRVGTDCKRNPKRCVQLMELHITITHVDSGYGISGDHPYKKRAPSSIYVAATSAGVAVSQQVLDRLIASGVDWAVDQDMIEPGAKACAADAWAPEIPKLLKEERKRCRGWEELLGTLDWRATSSTHRKALIHDATISRFFWREHRR